MEDQNNFYCKPAYKCGICGEVYDDVLSRARCEIACTKKKAEEERKAAKLKKEAEYVDRKSEVDAAFNHAYELKDKFVKDYGRYTYSKPASNAFDGVCLFDWFM